MAYSVSNRYKEVIYSGGAVNEAKLIINGTEIPNRQIESIEISDPFFDNTSNTFYLGQFVSKQITIKFKNTDGIPIEGNVELSISTLVDDVWEEVPIGKFLIETNNEDYYKYSKLTCLDYAVKLKTNCDFSSLVQKEDGTITPVTLENLLKWICEHYEIELGTYPNTNKDYLISTYDNSLSGKYYVSLIAELMGSNAHFGRDGKLYIIPIKQSSKATINALRSKTFSKTSSYTISKVVFDDGVRLVEKGTDDNNTLFIRSDNFFVLDNHEELITNIYNSVNGTKIDSLKTENNGDVSLDCFDLVTYTLGDETYTTFYNNKTMYQQVIMNTVETSIPTETQQKTTNVVGDDINPKLRKVYAKINQVEGSIELVSEKVDQISSDVTTSKTIEGNPIHITDAGEYDIDRLYLEGNNYQKVTQQGRNICPTDVSDWVLGQWTTTGETNTYQNRIRVNRLVPCKPNTTYYTQSFLASRVFAIRTFKADGTFNTSIGGVVRGGTFTTDANSYYLAITMYSEASSTEDLIAMIESGEVKPYITLNSETNRNFEEFIPNSPSPDYPSDIEVIEGSVDVEVVGKNLANYNDSVGKIFNFKIGDIIAGKNYSLFLNIDGVIDFHLRCGDGGTKIKTFYSVKGENVLNFTATEDAILFLNGWANASGSFNKISEIMLLEGTYNIDTIGDYEPYKSTTATIDLQDNFLAKIGDVKDELDVVTGKLTKRIGKVVLNGSENWLSASSVVEGTSRFYYENSNVYNEILSTSTKIYVISDKFVNTYWRGIYDGDKINKNLIANYNDTNNRSGRIVVRIDNNYASSVATFKTWLSQNNVTVYYVLAEPYEVQLDTNLIRLFKGINNISINANLEPSYVSLTYLVDNAWNSQYATKSQLEVTQNNINSVVKDTTTLNANLTDLQALVSVENTNLKNALGDLSNNLEENYATNDAVLTIENSVTNVQTSLNQQIEVLERIEVDGVTKLDTRTGFTFDKDGLTITSSEAETKTNIDEDGMVVYSTTGSEDTEMLVVDSKGVITENVTVRTYLVVGQNSRFQDYETGTGCFWIGSR